MLLCRHEEIRTHARGAENPVTMFVSKGAKLQGFDANKVTKSDGVAVWKIEDRSPEGLSAHEATRACATFAPKPAKVAHARSRESVSNVMPSNQESERHRFRSPQDCGRLRSACVGEAASFGGEAARAEIEASACWRSVKRLHVDTQISPASYSMGMENVASPGGRSAVRFSDEMQMNPGSRSTEIQNEPNKAVEPTPVAVTNRAYPPFGRARFAPATYVAHL